VASIGAFLRLTGQQQQGGITLEDLQRMTPAEVQAFLIQTAAPQEAPAEPVPQGVRPDFGLSTVSGIGQTAKSPYERTLRPGEERSAEDLQDMLAEVILAAGSMAVPGIGPHKLPKQAPGSRLRPAAPTGPDEYVYHGTNTERAAQIAADGKLRTFKPNYGTEQDAWPDGSTAKRSYFSPRQDVVGNFLPEGQPAILRVRKGEHFRTERYTGDVYSEKPTPLRDIEIMQPDGSWAPLSTLKGKP
jgi:hypothetical protein